MPAPDNHSEDAPDDTTAEDNTTNADVHVLHGAVQPAGDPETYRHMLSKARSNAVSRLRRDNREEYHRLVTQYMNALGYDYSPPLTPAQRAEQKIRELAETHGLPVRIETS